MRLLILDAEDNKYITNVNLMTNLEVLDASENCGIQDAGIKCINLTELHAENNLI